MLVDLNNVSSASLPDVFLFTLFLLKRKLMENALSPSSHELIKSLTVRNDILEVTSTHKKPTKGGGLLKLLRKTFSSKLSFSDDNIQYYLSGILIVYYNFVNTSSAKFNE